ncbi:amidohydrolase family protein [Roseateles sp.]|uniref:amidohydrolase family protein n=1 Tax=Roseateles sp. TaxID=1971397 RepID=UPI003D09E65A
MKDTTWRALALGPLMTMALLGSALASTVQREDPVQILDVVAGKQTAQTEARAGQTELRVDYHYSDRGRGPKLSVRWSLDAQGLPLHYSGEGRNESGGEVAERFDLSEGRAQWQNGKEKVQQALNSAAFYWPASDVPEALPVLARALLKAKGQRLRLLPEGEAWISSSAVHELSDAQGRRQRLVLYQIAGLNFMPQALWLDEQGQTVAVLSGWVNVVTANHASRQVELQRLQDEAVQGWHAELAKRLTHTPRGGALLLRGARLFDPATGQVRPGMSVLVRGERIVAVKPDADLPAPPEAELLDTAGRFLMPGLWDVHKHYDEIDGVLDLAAGITSARDMANRNELMLERVKRFASGAELGPRVHLAGIMEGVGERAGPTPIRVDTVEKAHAAVDWYGRHGYRMVKVYSLVGPELAAPIAERAAAWGMKMIGHGPHLDLPRAFVEAGASEVSHLNILAMELMPRDASPLARFSPKGAVLRRHVSENSTELKALTTWLRAHDTVLDPTLAVIQSTSNDNKATGPRALLPVLARLPLQVRRSALAHLADASRDPDFDGFLMLLKALHEQGVPMMPGSDGMAGFTLQHELELWVQAGIPATEVLRSATLLPARVMGVDRDQGRILPGLLADMVLVDGDPLQQISDVRRVWRTIKGGRVFDAQALETALGMAAR